MDELIHNLIASGVLTSAGIEKAFRAVDRADFVPEELRDEAYVDMALSIGRGQTISQPYTVAYMLELLEPRSGERILDVGSGSGWTTALLAHIVGESGEVIGVEIIPELVEMGKRNLAKYQFPHASITTAGKQLGIPGKSPFDRILVSAVSDEVPPELVEQLRVGGVMVLPIQNALWRVEKKSEKDIDIQKHEGFVFVPLIKP